MIQLTSFTDAAIQHVNIALEDGTYVQMVLQYYENLKGWLYSLTYGDFVVNNSRLVVSPNMLRAFRNVIPFGIAVITTDGYEPIYQNDFSTSRVSIYVLNTEDVLAAEVLIGQTIPAAKGWFIN